MRRFESCRPSQVFPNILPNLAFRTTPEPWWGVCYRTVLQSWGFVGMGGIPNTVRRGGVYHFRRAVPIGLRVWLARSELTCSLHTHQAGEARFLSRCPYLRSEELFVVIDALKELFETPIWTGCQSEHRRSKPGTHIIRDENFWLPLIAVFSGMRQEEICQLRLEDVRQAEGIWVFDLREGDGRQLKTATRFERSQFIRT